MEEIAVILIASVFTSAYILGVASLMGKSTKIKETSESLMENKDGVQS